MIYSILNDYYIWLRSKVTTVEVGYDKLLSYLHSIEFRWLIFNDKNRALDGHQLRLDYCEGDGFRNEVLNDYLPHICSVFEMMVALAARCEFDIMSNGYDDNTHIWFWEMIKNLDLMRFDDDHFDIDQVSYIVWTWMDRVYDENGKGSIFPLSHSIEDQRTLELWSQLNRYLDEHYEF